MSIFSKKILPATDGSKEAKLALRLGVRASVVWGHCHGSRLMSWQDYYHPRRFGRARADALHLQQREVGFDRRAGAQGSQPRSRRDRQQLMRFESDKVMNTRGRRRWWITLLR